MAWTVCFPSSRCLVGFLAQLYVSQILSRSHPIQPTDSTTHRQHICLHELIDGLTNPLIIQQVGIGNSTNAALLAIRILGAAFPEYDEKMKAYQKKMKNEVLAKDEAIRTMGWEKYLSRQQA